MDAFNLFLNFIVLILLKGLSVMIKESETGAKVDQHVKYVGK